VDTILQATAAVAILLVGLLLILRLEINVAPLEKIIRSQSGWVFAGMIAGIFLVSWGYFIFFETIWNGQTPGKRLVRLRVVREGGQPVDFACAAIRNLMRYLDNLPIFYGVGLVCIFLSPRYKRLGDYAAGTMVVKERSPHLIEIGTRREADKQAVAPTSFAGFSIDALSAEDLAAVRRFAERRADLPLEAQEQLARKLAEPIIAKIGLTLPQSADFSYADFLESVYALDRQRQSFR
jgi:uncharacterized RDD family membrane protein YckC